jgi:hypothetical protein
MTSFHFTPKSQQLLSFIIDTSSVPSPPPTQSSAAKSSMKSIYKDIKEANEYVLSLPPTTFYKKHLQSKREIVFPQSTNAHSFPDEIRRHIYDHIRTEVHGTFLLLGRNVTLYWMFEKEGSLPLCHKYALYVKIWLCLLAKYASKSCAEELVIYFYLTSHEKKLPVSKDVTLDVLHINTAFTTSCPSSRGGQPGEIVVFRKEEWFKVFIHETFHTFGLDFSEMNNEKVHQCIRTLFRIPSKINAFEAYAEFWAETMNVAFASFFYEPMTDVASFVARFEMGMNLERQFSSFQLAKVLHFMGITYDELLDPRGKGASNYRENTNVLAYYVIKTILMNQYPAFLQWCKSHNGPSLMAFRKTSENQLQFCQFIEKQTKHPALFTQPQPHPRIHKKREKFIMQTLRMSVIEWV